MTNRSSFYRNTHTILRDIFVEAQIFSDLSNINRPDRASERNTRSIMCSQFPAGCVYCEVRSISYLLIVELINMPEFMLLH